MARIAAVFFWPDLYRDTKLPLSSGHSTIWVICDRLTKFVHFIGLPTRYTAPDLARRFAVEVFRLHGMPRSITSDRDPLFLSSFWRELFKLRCFASDNPASWFRLLHLAEYWFNTAHHSAIGMPPFRALYGRHPPSVLDYVEGSASLDTVESPLRQRQ